MPTLVQMNFPLDGPWGAEMAEQFRDLAASINDEPGFIWKVWIENQAEGASGGIYLFDTRENAEKYARMHAERMAGFGVTGIEVIFSDVNESLSTLNKATLTPA